MRQQYFQIKSLTPKKAGGCQFDNLTLSPLDFSKMILRNGKALLFLTFSEDMKIFSFSFRYFCHFWGIIDISLLQKKLWTSAYNRWYQQLFSFNLLEIGCLIILFISVLDYFFLKNGESGNSEWITWNCCSLILKCFFLSLSCFFHKLQLLQK